jgi:hypothetical protein
MERSAQLVQVIQLTRAGQVIGINVAQHTIGQSDPVGKEISPELLHGILQHWL